MDEAKLRELALEFRNDKQAQERLREWQEGAEKTRETLADSNIAELSEHDMVAVLGRLNALTNEGAAQARMNAHGVDHVRDYLLKLVELATDDFSDEELREINTVEGFGWSVSSEILGVLNPALHWHWNDTVRKGLLNLGVDVNTEGLPTADGKTHKYFRLKSTVESVCDVLSEVLGDDVDLYVTTRFLIDVGLGRLETPRQYWKVSPGENASEWDEFREHSCIAIGGLETPDLTTIDTATPDELKAYFKSFERPPGTWQPAYAAKQYWAIWHEMAVGDMVVAYSGRRFWGIGEIIGDYYFDDNAASLPHRRSVEWRIVKPTSPDGLPDSLKRHVQGMATIISLTAEQFAEIERLLTGEERQVWLFQARPDRYDLETMLDQESSSSWWVKRFRSDIRPGDLVLLWKGGDNPGIYGLGTVASELYTREEDNEPSVDVRYDRKLSEPILREALMQDPVLSEMSVITSPQGTNFRVTEEQWQALQPLLPLPAPSIDALAVLRSMLAAQGLHFSDWQIATFYTALQTKGFVILSGISGTGKTKLAQHFSELLPQPAHDVRPPEDSISIVVQPYMHRYNRIIVPKRAARLIELPAPGEKRQVLLHVGEETQECLLSHNVYESTQYVHLLLRGKARQWFEENLDEGDTLVLEPDTDDEGMLVGFHLAAGDENSEDGDGSTKEPRGQNSLFVSVRPDWRDSKSLLGYYNPLTDTYEWTDFLRFLLRVRKDYESDNPIAWFVILDEMNLARVEYYFADLLSILESGRDEDGWTREPLPLHYPDDAEGDLPPREIYLPPNLYVVGTVNVDETTHAFSPKVLDRAFTLQLTEVDFSAYPAPATGEVMAIEDGQRMALLSSLRDEGCFAAIEKQTIADYISEHSEVRASLQTINRLLKPYEMHFGYRVFDEIVCFLARAERQDTFSDLGGHDAALDAAVLMKVLPKFHGSRGKLEKPLIAVLAWCMAPDGPGAEQIESTLQQAENSSDRIGDLAAETYQYPKTAARVLRMLRSLYTDGYAAFG